MVSERQVLNKLKKRYDKKNRDFIFYAKTVGSWFKPKISAYAVRNPLRYLEKEGIIERTGFSSNRITWRTCFGKKEK